MKCFGSDMIHTPLEFFPPKKSLKFGTPIRPLKMSDFHWDFLPLAIFNQVHRELQSTATRLLHEIISQARDVGGGRCVQRAASMLYHFHFLHGGKRHISCICINNKT